MKYYVVILPIIDQKKSKEFRPQHLDYLEEMRKDGKIFANGPFLDGSGGLIIYQAKSLDKAISYAQNDPYVIHKARGYEVHEWGMEAIE